MAGKNFAAALRQYQWKVRAFDALPPLRKHLQSDGADAVVLRGPCAGLPELVAMLRRSVPGLAVVWQAWNASGAERAAALDAGVDACAPAGMETLEWDALLRSLYRRGYRGARSWRVIAQERTLAGPAGERLPLTLRERAFFVRLFDAPGHCLHRERFFPNAAPDPKAGARRVDVVVSRLRTKARRFNIELPVLAVRGWGYILLPHGVPAPSRGDAS
ncbi:transcriptional regulator [Achromobacter spanius]|uniref:transcriptional regulator n=1 Tax=Achromobacter spanius TaxID=217203 RepID=UPI00320B6D09